MRIVGPAVISAAAALLAAHAAPAASLFPQGRLLFPTISWISADGAVALTFDNGPDRGVHALPKLLEEYGARATFFVVGEQVECSPSRLEEIVAQGHEVAVHCYRHRNHLCLNPSQVMEDMRRVRDIVEEVAGHIIQLLRPPYGLFSLASWLEASRQDWGRDWEARSSPEFISSRIDRPEAGDILLLHDSARYAVHGSSKYPRGITDPSKVDLPSGSSGSPCERAPER